MSETTKVEQKQEGKELDKTAQGFATAYQNLCELYGFRIVVSPTWVATNHNSFEMVNQYQVGALPKEETK